MRRRWGGDQRGGLAFPGRTSTRGSRSSNESRIQEREGVAGQLALDLLGVEPRPAEPRRDRARKVVVADPTERPQLGLGADVVAVDELRTVAIGYQLDGRRDPLLVAGHRNRAVSILVAPDVERDRRAARQQ